MIFPSVNWDSFPRKNCCSFRLCPNYLPPRPFPQFGQPVQLLSSVKIKDLKVNLGLKILYIHDIISYICNLKKQFKVQIIGIWRKSTPLIDQKCTYEKVPTNFGRALPPHIWTKSKRRAISSREIFPMAKNQC